MILVDANIIVYRHIRGPLSGLADALLRKDSDWVTAPLWRCEFVSAAVKMIRAGVLDQPTATDALAAAESEMAMREHEVPQAQALRAALDHGLSAYDGQYVALAVLLTKRCVTADVALVRKAPRHSVLLTDFVAEP